jgi:Holliday junction resolvasome RuvABC endonuclease subunit
VSTVEQPAEIYVGIDASLTGYAVVLWWPGGLKDVLISTKAAGDSYALRLDQIRRRVVEVLTPAKDDIRLIAMERPAYAASGAFTGGLVHAATAFALLDVFGPDDLQRIAPVLVAGNTLKKFVTGKGNGPKSVMLKHVYSKWGYDTDDDNLADAYGLARLAAAVTSGAEHKYEQDCIDTVRRSMSWEPLPPQQTPSSPRQRVPAGSTSSSPRTKSSSASGTAATSSNSRRASRSRSRTPSG